jgi:hypothetical protein
MYLVKDLINRYYNDFIICKQNNIIDIYKGIQLISLSNAYLWVNFKEDYDPKRLDILNYLYKNYEWIQLKKVISKIDRNLFSRKEVWINEVKKYYHSLRLPYQNLLMKLMNKDEILINKCLSHFSMIEKTSVKPIELTKSFKDVKIPYSIGRVIYGGREK